MNTQANKFYRAEMVQGAAATLCPFKTLTEANNDAECMADYALENDFKITEKLYADGVVSYNMLHKNGKFALTIRVRDYETVKAEDEAALAEEIADSNWERGPGAR